MQIFDLKAMRSFPYGERDKNVFYKTEDFKVRIIELPAGGQIPHCDMTSHVIFHVISGAAEVRVDQENAFIEEGQCLITAPATISLKTATGVKIMGIQIGK